MSVDDLCPEQWSDELDAALDKWRQGQLLKADQGTWLALGGAHDPVIDDDLSHLPAELTARQVLIAKTGYLAVVSQTCDIAARGPGRVHPFVQVCPVVDIGEFDKGAIAEVKRGAYTNLVYLTKPPVAGKEWAIDLRLSVPLSKGALASLKPLEGFASHRDELSVGRRLADKIMRVALHDFLAEDVVRGLEGFVKQHRESDTWCDDIEQMRLEIQGDRLAPEKVRLLVICEVKLDRTARVLLRNHWKTYKRQLRQRGMKLEPAVIRKLDSLTVQQYRDSVPLNIEALGRVPFV